MKEETRFPKCESEEKVKNGYPESTKREVLKYYTEGLGFIQIKRLMHINHVSVVN